jgi:cytochrome c oxidase subunit 2
MKKKGILPLKRLIVLSLIAAVLSFVLIFIFLHFNFLPESASLEQQDISSFLKLLFSIASVIFSVIIVVFADSLIFFRRRPGDNSDGPPIKNYARLERGWTLIPLFIVVGLASYGAVVLNDMTTLTPLPDTELKVEVNGQRFAWTFTYPDYNITTYTLELPVNHSIVLFITSKDVVHSFWVPEFGPKQDAVPGLTTVLRITPTQEGKYTAY